MFWGAVVSKLQWQWMLVHQSLFTRWPAVHMIAVSTEPVHKFAATPEPQAVMDAMLEVPSPVDTILDPIFLAYVWPRFTQCMFGDCNVVIFTETWLNDNSNQHSWARGTQYLQRWEWLWILVKAKLVEFASIETDLGVPRLLLPNPTVLIILNTSLSTADLFTCHLSFHYYNNCFVPPDAYA